MKNNLLDLLFARCPVETGGVRCWFAAEHEGDHRGPDGRPLAMPPEVPARCVAPPTAVCAWNDLGGCEGERLAVTFNDGNRGHLCQKHHEQWIYKPAVESCAWNDLGGCMGERRYLCQAHFEEWVSPGPCTKCDEWQETYLKACEKYYEQKHKIEALETEPKPACTRCAELEERLFRICLAYGRVVGFTVKRDGEEKSIAPGRACARCGLAIDDKARHHDGVPGYGKLCSSCHQTLLPVFPGAKTKTCAQCGLAIDEKGRFYAGVPGRGDLCLSCHQAAFP